MKICHIGDMHLGLGYPGPTPESRFEDITRVMDWCADRIIEENCGLVLIAGDMFKDARVYLDRASREIMAIRSWLKKLSNFGCHIIAISGTPSHDAISAYEILDAMRIENVDIFSKPAIRHSWTGVEVACLPGMNRSSLVAQEEYRSFPPHEIHQIMTDQITKSCQSMRDGLFSNGDGPKILLGHLTYDLADKGFEDVLMQHEPILTQEAIQGYDLVCLGHIHRPQQNGKVFYCGSPERLTFNDENIIPGFWIHDLQDGLFASRFIETPGRRFIPLNWNEGDMRDCINHGDLFLGYADIQDAIVRLRYTCPEDIAKRLDKKALEQALYDAGAFYVTEISGTVTESTRNREEEVTAEMGPVEAVRKWCEQPEINIDPQEIPFLLDMTAGLLGGVSE